MVKARAHKLGLQGSRGMSTPLHCRLRLHINQLFRVWARVLFDSDASHSFVAASYVKELGLNVETLEKPLHVNSPLGNKGEN